MGRGPDAALRSGRGLERPGIARARLIVGRPGIDQLPPLRGVGFREQSERRHLGEVGIAVERVAIRERELQRLGDRVDVLRRVVAHPLEIEALQDGERLEQDRALTPEARLEDLERAVPGLEGPPRRRLDAALVAGEIGLRQQAARLLYGPGAAPAAIDRLEAVPSGYDRRLAAALPVPLLGLDEGAQRPREVGLAEDAPDGGDRPTRA